MALKNFNELIEILSKNMSKKKVAVVSAQDEHTLQAVFRAAKEGIVEPVLVGNKEAIIKTLEDIGEKAEGIEIIESADEVDSARIAVEMVNAKKVDFLMKGKIQTADLLRAVVNKETGLGTGKVMSAVSVMEIPSYHKMICLTDGGMMMYPTLEEKKDILQNAVDVMHSLGIEEPKVAVLAAIETVNPKMPETVDADQLKQMNVKGEIKGCIVEGPISLDLSVNKESAIIKGYSSPVAGDADIFLVPDIQVGNIFSKALIELAGAKSAGMIVGAKVPVVVTSRSTTAEEKYLSLVVSAAASK